MSKTIIIADVRSFNVEGKAVGHYFTVASNYVDMFSDRCNVLVAGGPLYEKKFSNILRLDYDTSDVVAMLVNKKRVLSNIRQLFKVGNESTVVLQCSAVATVYLGIVLFKPKNCRLYMIQYNTLGLDSIVKKFLYTLAKRKISGTICPQKEIGKAYGRPYCIVPDYIYTSKSEARKIPYAQKEYDFGMVGIIARDKGIIEAAQKLRNTKYRVLIAGFPQTPEIEQELREVCKNASNIELNLNYLSESEYQNSIYKSRYCILNYSGAYSEHSSGVVFDILFSGVPVIGRKCKSLDFISTNRLGYIFDDIEEWDPELVMSKEFYLTYQENINQYYKQHEIFKENLAAFLDI